MLSRYHGVLAQLAELTPGGSDAKPEPNLLPLSAEAKRAWISFHDENAIEQEALEGDLAAAWSKLTGYGARFALVTHLMRIAEGDVSADRTCVDLRSMQCGIALSRWAANEAERVYAAVAEDDDVRAVRQRVEVIERDFGGAVTARDWHKRNNRRTPEEARRELEEVVVAGLAKWRPRKGGDKGGRPTDECAIVSRSRPARDRVGVSGADSAKEQPPADQGVSGCGVQGAVGLCDENGLPGVGNGGGAREDDRLQRELHPKTPSGVAVSATAKDGLHPGTRNPADHDHADITRNQGEKGEADLEDEWWMWGNPPEDADLTAVDEDEMGRLDSHVENSEATQGEDEEVRDE